VRVRRLEQQSLSGRIAGAIPSDWAVPNPVAPNVVGLNRITSAPAVPSPVGPSRIAPGQATPSHRIAIAKALRHTMIVTIALAPPTSWAPPRVPPSVLSRRAPTSAQSLQDLRVNPDPPSAPRHRDHLIIRHQRRGLPNTLSRRIRLRSRLMRPNRTRNAALRLEARAATSALIKSDLTVTRQTIRTNSGPQ